MKKALVVTILGLAAAVNTFAQGTVAFGNFSVGLDAPITYGAGSGGLNGQLVPGPTFTAVLYYQFGSVSAPAGSGGATIPGGWTLAAGSATAIDAGDPGYFYGPNVSISPGYTPNSAISFIVAASGTVSGTTYFGYSSAFTLSKIATGTDPVTGLGANVVGSGFQAFVVNPVPEPSTFALAGLGLASLLIFRRRK